MKKILVLMLMMLSVSGVAGVLVAEPVGAIEFADGMTPDPSCESSLVGLKPWYAGLVGKTKDGKCVVGTPKSDKDDNTNMTTFVWTIVLNVLEDLFIIAGYLALGFIIYGGYAYMTSAGDPGKATKGKSLISSAVVGLIIAILATSITSVLTNILTGAVSGDDVNLTAILNWAYALSGLVAVGYIIYGGVLYMTSGGDPGKAKRGGQALLYSIVGLIVVLLAAVITNFVFSNF